MLVALDSASHRCIAWEAEKDEAPFFCPECQADVTLKKGRVRQHHYAHKPPTDCPYGEGESELHLRAKKEIYQSLAGHRNCTKCEIERRLQGVRPDVSLRIGAVRVAIEIQKSTIDIDEIRRRTLRYSQMGIHVLWVVPTGWPHASYQEEEKASVHRIKEWEKYLHAMYYGRVYYWQGAANVRPYHFGEFERYVPESEWYSQDGILQTAGGYDRYTKTLKKVVPFEQGALNLADDFGPRLHDKEFRSKNWTIPICRIWMDAEKKWW